MPSYVFDLNTTGRGGSTDEAAGQDLNLEYEVNTDTAGVTADDVIAAAAVTLGIAKGVAHPSYAYAKCTTIRAEPNPLDPFRWLLTAVFKEPPPVPGAEINPTGGQPTPEDRPPWFRGSFRREEEYRLKDLDNNPFVNSAGDPFENPPPVYTSIGILNITIWKPSVNYFTLFSYLNTCNNDTWQGFPKHSLLCVGLDFVPKTERGWLGYEITAVLEYKKKRPPQEAGDTGGWRRTGVLDQGFAKQVAVGMGYEKRQATDAFGQPTTTPILLNGVNGQASTDGPHYVWFTMYAEQDFSFFAPP